MKTFVADVVNHATADTTTVDHDAIGMVAEVGLQDLISKFNSMESPLKRSRSMVRASRPLRGKMTDAFIPKRATSTPRASGSVLSV